HVRVARPLARGPRRARAEPAGRGEAHAPCRVPVAGRAGAREPAPPGRPRRRRHRPDRARLRAGTRARAHTARAARRGRREAGAERAGDAARARGGASNDVIRWRAPGPYVVAFTERGGGVSTGGYASLNLGSRGDDRARMAENRRLACAELGLDASRLA